ncbi:DUF2062 domain-containing protein [Candidatus Dependentiae bacterium]|nr:DUF2062 domain-containing protein [Candidatus Dependentiae bacterium]
MNIIKKIKNVFKQAFTSGWSVEKLTLSFCMGIYIAFSPFPGAHTIMMLIAKWMFKLNFPVLFVATSINNPWTMVPFFTFDYIFGYWFLHQFIGWDPGWSISLSKIMGSGKICLFSFLIGGNILGIFFALTAYPIMIFIFKRLVNRFKISEKLGI